jgi:GAF domain-containing protein
MTKRKIRPSEEALEAACEAMVRHSLAKDTIFDTVFEILQAAYDIDFGSVDDLAEFEKNRKAWAKSLEKVRQHIGGE